MFIPAGGYLLNTVEFGTAPDVFVEHGGSIRSCGLMSHSVRAKSGATAK